MASKKTLILGASPNPSRFSNIAAHRLLSYEHEIILVGLKKGEIEGNVIHNIQSFPRFNNIDTITLYMNLHNQRPYYHYIIDLKPVRIIFNPGTENVELAQMAKANGIEVVNNCTLIMLDGGYY